MQSAITSHRFRAQEGSVQLYSYTPWNFGHSSIYHCCCLLAAVLLWAGMTCCVAVWKQLELELLGKRDPFEPNHCDLVQRGALQTSAPAGEWCTRLAICSDSVFSSVLFYHYGEQI